MGAIAEAVRHMMKAGMPVEAVVEAVAAMEKHAGKDEQAERRRAKDRERKRLAKSGIPRNSADSAENAELPPLKERSPPAPPLKKITPPSSRREASQCFDRDLIIEALGEVLDPGHAVAVADYRTKGRKDKFSLYAAGLLAKALAKAPDPNAAADAMICNGWQGFEADWLTRRQTAAGAPRAGPGPGPGAPRRSGSDLMVDTTREMLAELHADNPDDWRNSTGSTIDVRSNRAH